MSDRRDDGADWLASRFGGSDAEPDPGPDDEATGRAAPAPPPPADGEPPLGAGGFAWGLRPGGEGAPRTGIVPYPGASPIPPGAGREQPVAPPAASSGPPAAPTPPAPQPPAGPTPPPAAVPPHAATPPPAAVPPPAAGPPSVDGPATQAWTPPSDATQAMPPVSADMSGAPHPADTVGFGVDAGSWGGADGLGFEPAPPVAPVPYRPSSSDLAGPPGASGAPGPPNPAADPDASGIDALFGEHAFAASDADDLAGGDGPPLPPADATPRPPSAPLSRLQRTLLIVVSSVVGALVLVMLFVLGTRLPIFTAPVAEPTAPPTPEIPAADAVGPLSPGTYLWNQLIGGECLEPFDDAWQDTYVVIACARPHHGQLVLRGEFPDPLDPAATAAPADPAATASPAPVATDPAFPGEAALAEAADRLCRAAGALDYAAASAITDAQLQAAYPVSAEQWADGNRFYYCFVSRSSGQTLTDSIAPSPAPSPSEAPAG